MSDYPRGHDMSEMGHLTLPGETAAYIAKLEARIAEQDTTIRRLSDENAALKALLCDLGGGPVAIYGTDFPECPSSAITQERFNEKMDELDRQNPEAELNARKICGLPPLVTRWRNGKRYELTPEDARRFDEGEE